MPFIAMDIDQSSSVDINIPVSHHHSDVINDWNWWPGGAEGCVVSNDVVEGATVVASSSTMNNSAIGAFGTDYDEDWLAQQLANIPLLNINDGASASGEIIQINQNTTTGNGYTLVADRELSAILGGHVDRDTIYWLLANFKLERNAVMPRGFLYSKYEAFCLFHGKPLMNQACMGKTVRALFRGLETRRLGRRGKSRYHYIGLAINQEGEFAGMVPIEPEEPAPEPGDGERKRRRTTLAAKKLQENPIGKHFEALDPDSRTEAALDQLEKILNVRRNRYVIPQRLRTDPSWNDSLPFADDGLVPLGLTAADMGVIFRILKCHMGLLGHSILSGVLFSIPSILENLWVSQIPSLQIPEHFDRHKFSLSLTWPAFNNFIGMCYTETYATVLDLLLGKTDKAQNSSFLDFLYEFATKYGQWVKSVSMNLPHQVQVMLNASASSFCQTMKQLAILNSALALVDLVERDRSKAAVAAEGFKSLSDRFVMTPFSTCGSEHIVLSVQTISMMEFIFQHDHMLQRWRGWVRRIMEHQMENVELDCAGLNLPMEEAIRRKELTLNELRLVWISLLTEMQKNVERSGKDYATPVTFILSYFMHYVNYALDSFQAKLYKQTLPLYGYQVAKNLLETVNAEYFSIPATPSYDITFFTQRLLADQQMKINVHDFHFYGNFDELRSIICMPHLGPFEVIGRAHPLPHRSGDLSTEDRRLRDENFNSSILAEYLQPSQSLLQDHSMSMALTEPMQLDVQSDGMHVVPDHDLLDEMERQFHHES